jgi:histidine triad (HIT) family protein
MNQDVSCPFCRIISGDDPNVREVARNHEVVIFFPKEPATLGHCLIVPIRHVETFTDLATDELQQVMSGAQEVAKRLNKVFHPDGINIVQSNGAAASQTVAHVHVHVLPRWENDAIKDFWPEETGYSDQEKDATLAKLRAAITLSGVSQFNAEDRRQHLSFIQNIINRMAGASSNSKTWLLPIATAAYGYAIANKSIMVTALGMIATFILALLDAGYLTNERRYRQLYNQIISNPNVAVPFSLSCYREGKTRCARFKEYIRALKSWSIVLFYGALLLTGISIMLLLKFGYI